MLPADQVEALERLVDEVERVAAVGKGALGRGREQDIGERGRREHRRDRGQQGALGRIAMAHGGPAPQPALERGRIGPASKRRAFPSRRLAVAVRRDAARAVEQREIGLLFRQHGEEIAERREDGQADAPAVAVLRAEQRRLPHDLGARHAAAS